MEKIYMEEEKQTKKLQNDAKFSIVLSFFVAFFAIFSLIAFGFDQISYAVDPESPAANSMIFYFKTDANNDKVFIKATDDNGYNEFGVPQYFAFSNFKEHVFCIQFDKKPSDSGISLSLKGSTNDAGLAYIMNHSFLTNKYRIFNDIPLNEDCEVWATQVAIWSYLYEKGDANNKNFEKELDKIKKVTKIYKDNGDVAKEFSSPIYDKYIANLVQAARAADAAGYFQINKENNKLTKVDGTDLYQTSKLSVSGDDELKTFDVSLSGVEGAYVVDKDGQTMSNLTGLNPNTEFYVRIPAKSIDSAKNLKITCKGNFDVLEPFTYQDGSSQSIVRVYEASASVHKIETYEVVGTPETGMNATQTIYFVGLIVLLCGVGIVYANAKPIKE